MADEKPQMVTVKALKYHTGHGKEHAEGSTYDVEASQVDNLVAQGMVAAPEAPPAPKRASQPVEPITTAEFRPKQKK
jgi:hypothetical protein